MLKKGSILQVREVMKTYGWNKHLPQPLKANEIVVVAEDQKEERWVKIKHGKGAISTFDLAHFKIKNSK